jgi:hypothetical protein
MKLYDYLLKLIIGPNITTPLSGIDSGLVAFKRGRFKSKILLQLHHIGLPDPKFGKWLATPVGLLIQVTPFPIIRHSAPIPDKLIIYLKNL